MPTFLRKLKITRVAACAQGANYDEASGAGAHILLFKSAPEDDDCTDDDCTDPDCPTHGFSAVAAAVDKNLMTPHQEPDLDEAPPHDYATRSQQRELWSCLWDKWSAFCDTFHDVIGDCDDDNIPHLPILVTSIAQFQADVAGLLESCGVMEKAAPLLSSLSSACAVRKAGAAMASKRRARLQAAIDALQALLEECTPEDVPHGVNPPVNRAGVSAAEVAGVSLTTPTMKGASMADNSKLVTGNVAQGEIDTLTKQVQELQTELATSQTALAKAQAEVTALTESAAIAKMSPEEQRTALLASMPELVRKSYLDQEARLQLVEKTNNDLRDRNERMEYIAKAAELRGVGFVPDDHWPILKAIDHMPDETARTELLRLLTAANEQLRSSVLFSARGTEGHQNGGGQGSAEEQLMALARSHSEEKGVPLDKAIDAVVKAHPDLYQRNMLEKRQTNRVQLGSR